MDMVLLLQVLFLFLTFAFTLLSVLLPLKLIPRDPGKELGTRSQRILSFCNCVGGGVFLATCFLQLVPFVHMKFTETLRQLEWSTRDVMFLTQLSVMLGFFLIVFIEQCIHKCQKHPESQEENKQLLIVPKHPGDYAACITSSESTGSDDSDSEHVLLDRKQLMRKKRPKRKPARNGRAKSSGDAEGAARSVVEPAHKVDGTQTHHRHEHQHQHQHHHGNLHNHDHHHHHQHEHGHSHLVGFMQGELSIRCLLLLAALSLHSLFEGMAVGLQENVTKLVSLFIGIIIHEVLVSFAMGVNLAKQRFKMKTLIPLAVVYSLMIPVGMGIGMALGEIHNFGGDLTSALIQGLTAGTFLYVIFLEILPPELNNPKDRMCKMIFLFVGFVLVGAITFLLPHHEHD